MLLLMLYCLTPGTQMYSVETVRRLTMGLMLGGQDFDRIEKNANGAVYKNVLNQRKKHK